MSITKRGYVLHEILTVVMYGITLGLLLSNYALYGLTMAVLSTLVAIAL